MNSCGDIVCTLRGVRLEVGSDKLERWRAPTGAATRAAVEAIVAGSGRAFVDYAPYRRGSAFLREPSDG